MTRLQCRHCPWKTTTNPRDIPNGYCETKHRKLKETIAQPDRIVLHTLRMMACHESGGDSWMMAFAGAIPRDGLVAVSAEDFQLAHGILAGDDRPQGRPRPRDPVLTPIPVDVVYFQERREGLVAASATSAQEGDDAISGLMVITPREGRSLAAADVVFPRGVLSLADFGPLSMEAPALLRRWLAVVGFRQLASAGFASTGSALKAFSVRAEFLHRLRPKTARASLHRVITPQLSCVGWMHNQLGVGNNIGLRLACMRDRTLADVETVGPQHETFKDTLP